MPSNAASSHPAVAPNQRAAGLRQVVSDYVEMTKPKVQSLLLLTTVCSMEIAGDPSVGLIALTVLGGYLSAGGAGAVNHWYDRDIDASMARTADRPVASGRVAPNAALVYGLVLAALAVVVLTVGVNPLAAARQQLRHDPARALAGADEGHPPPGRAEHRRPAAPRGQPGARRGVTSGCASG